MGGKTSKVVKVPSGHNICRGSDPSSPKAYMGSQTIFRSVVPNDKIQWSEEFSEYEPVDFTSAAILRNPEWADPANPWNIFNWNKLTVVDRRSEMGNYEVIHGIPRNPVGRTGIKGRGRLGKWGPNHAADPVVTRWKTDDNGKKVKHPESKKFILQFVAIQRSDTNEWAIPGGMCDPGETVSKTLKREFLEEAADVVDPVIIKRNKEVAKKFDDFFKKGQNIYRGYVDDPRNTDNAWMETVVQSFHDNKNAIFKNFELKAGDDATNVAWLDIDDSLQLYATHKTFVELVAKKYKAHWSKPVPKVKKTKPKKEKKNKKEKSKQAEEKLLDDKHEEENKAEDTKHQEEQEKESENK